MAYRKGQEIPKETMVLAVRWMRDEVSTREVMEKLMIKGVTQAVYCMGIALRQAKREKVLVKRCDGTVR